MTRRCRVLLAAALLAWLLAGWCVRAPVAHAEGVASIAISANHLVNWLGEPVVLRGADTSGTEYACVSEKSIFDGSEQASPSSIAAMRSWGFNAARTPRTCARAATARVELNESCWLGVQGVKPAYSGSPYREAIEQYVDALEAAGMYG